MQMPITLFIGINQKLNLWTARLRTLLATDAFLAANQTKLPDFTF